MDPEPVHRLHLVGCEGPVREEGDERLPDSAVGHRNEDVRHARPVVVDKLEYIALARVDGDVPVIVHRQEGPGVKKVVEPVVGTVDIGFHVEHGFPLVRREQDEVVAAVVEEILPRDVLDGRVVESLDIDLHCLPPVLKAHSCAPEIEVHTLKVINQSCI